MKGTWKIFRKAMNKEAEQCDIEKIFVDNEEVNDKQEISEWFNDHLVTIGEKLAKDIPQSSSLHWSISQKSTRMRTNSSLKC